jgi:hypothetical protein
LNKKGQAGNVMSVLLIVVLTGILLAVFQPTINDFRLQNIENIDNYPDQYSALMKLFMYGLLPIMWIFYIFLSILIVFVTVNQGG